MSIRLDKNIATIRSALFARIEAVQDEYAAKGYLPVRLNLNKGIIRGIIELFAWGLWQLYNFLNTIHAQAIPTTSSGDWLDLHAKQVSVVRKDATKALGTVTFLRGEATGNVRIPAGRIVRTLADGTGAVYRYVTDTLTVLPEGALSIAVAVTAEEYGQGSNAAVGQIAELVTPVEGIGGVTNSAGWLTAEGTDAENDASLQRRYALAWKSQAGVTRAAYEAVALAVPGVVDVYVADQHPRGEGTVDVVVQGSAGLPTDGLLENVRAALETTIVINHDLLVKAPTPVAVEVRATLELVSGNAAETLAGAEAWVRSMFTYGDSDIPRFGIGKDVVRDRLASGIISITGVKRIVWGKPTADMEIPADGLAVLSALDLRTAWADQA